MGKEKDKRKREKKERRELSIVKDETKIWEFVIRHREDDKRQEKKEVINPVQEDTGHLRKRYREDWKKKIWKQ